MFTKKDRRHSGWVTARPVKGGGMKWKDMIAEGLDLQEYWDDWKDYRDGFRAKSGNDRKLIRSRFAGFGRYFDVKRWNDKLKRLILRRKAKRKV